MSNDKISRKLLIFGQDPDILLAALANIISWFVSTFVPTLLPYLLPKSPEEEPVDKRVHQCSELTDRTKCISIGRPGGMEQLRFVTLREGICTIGYNVRHLSPPPYANTNIALPSDCVVIQNEAFSVNYADCTIRWGLYESAKKYVGWPIVPGFDVAGTVERIPDEITDGSNDRHKLAVNDRVFGCTLFGAYSNRILIPKIQLRKIPDCITTFAEAAAFPAVSLTALYALHLAGYFPIIPSGGGRMKFKNKSILIHSAAGGLGASWSKCQRY